MNKICETIMWMLPSVFIWWAFLTFVNDNSRFQKNRLRKSIDNIYSYIMANTKESHPPIEFNIIHKNKKFAIGIIKDEVNYHYYNYRIFINGEEAGVFHILRHTCLNSYHLESVNKRHCDEVTSILHAGNKVLKQMSKNKKEKKDGYTEYSYFK